MVCIRRFINNCRRKILTAKMVLKDNVNTIQNIGIDLETEILLLCHALEKGMGIKNVKYGYGEKKASKLIDLLIQYKTIHGEKNYVFLEAVGVLNAYLSYQKNTGYDIAAFEDKYINSGVIRDKGCKAGYENLSGENMKLGTNCNYEQFIRARKSCRSMSKEEIKQAQMEHVIELAIRAPSACNRQPWKVFYTLDITKNKALSELIPGNKSFADEIPYYCVVSVDKKYFGPEEIYQWYVNGGIFLDELVLAMHSQGIGSCIFQWPEFYMTEKKLRALIGGISPSEVIVAVVGYGMYAENAKYICASRRSVEEVGQRF